MSDSEIKDSQIPGVINEALTIRQYKETDLVALLSRWENASKR